MMYNKMVNCYGVIMIIFYVYFSYEVF